MAVTTLVMPYANTTLPKSITRHANTRSSTLVGETAAQRCRPKVVSTPRSSLPGLRGCARHRRRRAALPHSL